MASSIGEGTVGRASLNNNKVNYSWGANSYGQLAQGHRKDQLEPREVTLPITIKHVTGGGGHTLALSENGTLWACGSNNKGQLGLGTRAEEVHLKIVPYFQDIPIACVAGGWDFSLAASEAGDLYVWGSNGFGQLGAPELQGLSPLPVKVKLDYGEKVTCVATGLRHSAVCTESGRVYCWGSGKKGQCGVTIDNNPPTKVNQPAEVTLPEECGHVVSVVCGSYHTAVLTDSGQVVFWGCNKAGLSTQEHKEVKQHNVPYMIGQDMFQRSKVVRLRSGWSHMVALTDTGEIYTWGSCPYGQLGRVISGGKTCDHKPGVVTPALHGVKSFVCGSEHTLATTGDDRLVAWGWNEHGICGRKDEVNIHNPLQVAALSNKRVTLIGCGAGHCFAVAENSDGFG